MLEIMYVSVWGTYLRWYENADETKPEIEIGSNQKGPDGIDLHFSLAICKGIFDFGREHCVSTSFS